MNQTVAIQRLRDALPALQKRFGIQKMGIFGSVARNAASETSDIDIVVVMPPSAFDMVHLKTQLEQLLQSSVDVVRYRPNMNAFLKARIDQEAIYV